MSLLYLQHFLIYAKDMEKTKEFYVNTLGLKVGPRPAFPFPGYWLYLNDIPVVHIVSVDSVDESQQNYLESKRVAREQGRGPINHLAFVAKDFEKTVVHLERLGVEMRHRIVPEENNTHQVFIRDPNGIGIELNFSQS